MICYAAFTPHSPLLLKSIGKENTEKLNATLSAMHLLGEELYASHPDVIVTISTHQRAHTDAFSVNLHDEYMIDFSEFGDLSTAGEFAPDLELITRIQEFAQKENISFTLDSDARLDYGVGVPLSLLTQDHKKPRLVPVSYSNLSPKAHVQFGRVLKDVFLSSKKRIAVIASGDLAHTLSSDAPAGFHPSGEIFDQSIIQSIEQLSLSQLLSMDPDILRDASESSYKSLLILFGIIDRMHVRPEILSYEHPFGVGELAVQFHFSSL